MQTFELLEKQAEDSVAGFRLSPQQRRVWTLEQQGVAHRAQCAIMIEGVLVADTLKQALAMVVARSEILRTRFRRASGMRFPLQVISPVSVFDWESYNVGLVDAQRQEEAIDELLRHQWQEPYDFQSGPLVRALLVARAPQEHLLIITLPALCADRHTLENLVFEISLCYRACMAEEELSETPVQYVEFSEWQNQLLESVEAEAGKDYWRRQQDHAAHDLMLPFEIKADRKAATELDSFIASVDGETAAKLEDTAAKYDVHISTLLMACWQTLLWRLTRQRDVTIGAVFNGRKYEELNDALGLFVKWLPLDCHFEPNFRFAEVLDQVNRSIKAAFEWEECFTYEPEEGDAAGPDCSIGFEYCHQPRRHVVEGVAFSTHKQFVRFNSPKLTLCCFQSADQLSAEISYGSGSFASDDIRRLSEQFRTLLKSVANNPETSIAELEVISDSERRELLAEFNATKTDYPACECAHHLFERQAEQTPHNAALEFDGRQVSYAELNARANQLAHYLCSLGVGPGALVGISLERSPEMVIAILAALKSGGAYVPVDPTYPKQRLEFIFEDASMAVLITTAELAGRLPASAAKLLCLDTDGEFIRSESRENPINRATAEDLAYVIYTSGTTGRPKGVMVCHGGLVNYLSWAARSYATRGQGAPVHSPLSFDLTVTSLFCPLVAGETVMLIPENQGIQGLASSLTAGGDFSLIKITPSHLELLSRQLQGAQVKASARAFVIGGEALSADGLAFWRRVMPEARFINEYGPTETVVGCCVYEVPIDSTGSSAVPIGRPIANTQIYLLDEQLRLAPAGAEGEIYIGGVGLARGYLNRPDLTAERFVPDPFAEEPGARLYRTGDIARYVRGNIEFIGRNDYQVKIRGFRIELPEIDAVLTQHASVREAVTVAREDVPGEKRLVAYVVAVRGQLLNVSDLIDFSRRLLPAYMVPSAFVILETLPLTHNGKIDRRALPKPESHRPELREAQVAPRNELERTIAAIWQAVLQVDRPGIHDNFFDLGGHSLLMVECHTRLQEVIGRDVPIINLFQYPTISALAGYLSQGRTAAAAFEQSHSRADIRRESARRQRLSRRQHP